MKAKIEWYEENLRNSNIGLKEKKLEFKKILDEITLWQQRNNFLQYQINEAKKEGKTEFDADRYKVKRTKSKVK